MHNPQRVEIALRNTHNIFLIVDPNQSPRKREAIGPWLEPISARLEALEIVRGLSAAFCCHRLLLSSLRATPPVRGPTMEDPPSPSNASSPSRRGSHINTVVRGTPPHPKHVDYPKDDRASFTDRIKNSFDWRSKKSMDGSKDEANEHSPLMGPRESAEVGELPPYETALTPPSRDESDNADDRSQETKSSWYLFLLTFALGG